MSERTTFPQRKTEAIAALEGYIRDADAIYLTDFTGLSVENITQLRNKLHEQQIRYLVVKNTLTKIALHNCGITDLDQYLNGPIGLAFGKKDPSKAAKILFEFAKTLQKPEIKSCLFEGKAFGPDKIAALKDLPSRDEVLSMLLGQIQAPLANFVFVLNEIVRSFLGVLDAVIQQKQQQENT